MDDIFVPAFTGEEISTLIEATTKGFAFNRDRLNHVLGSEAYQDEVGVWSRVTTMPAALMVYKWYQSKYGVSAIVKHTGNQIWVWKAPLNDYGNIDTNDNPDEDWDDTIPIVKESYMELNVALTEHDQ